MAIWDEIPCRLKNSTKTKLHLDASSPRNSYVRQCTSSCENSTESVSPCTALESDPFLISGNQLRVTRALQQTSCTDSHQLVVSASVAVDLNEDGECPPSHSRRMGFKCLGSASQCPVIVRVKSLNKKPIVSPGQIRFVEENAKDGTEVGSSLIADDPEVDVGEQSLQWSIQSCGSFDSVFMPIPYTQLHRHHSGDPLRGP